MKKITEQELINRASRLKEKIIETHQQTEGVWDDIKSGASKVGNAISGAVGGAVQGAQKGYQQGGTAAAPAATAKATVPANVQTLAKANGIADPNKIQPGQKIKMPDGSEYVVKAGDTLGKIAAMPPSTKPAAAPAGSPAAATSVDAAKPAGAAAPATTTTPPATNTAAAPATTTTPAAAPATPASAPSPYALTPKTGGIGLKAPTAESISYSEDQALARIVQLARG